MSNPTISIILPTYNRRALVARALASVARQDYRDFELIAVDDGSTDGTAESVVGDGLPAMKLVRHPQNRGAAAARNSGIRAARGEWIAFLDSDDTRDPRKLAAQIAYVQGQADQPCANCTGFRLHRRGHVREICLEMQPGEFASQILWGCTISPGSTLMVRRAAIDKVGLFNESLRRLEDWDSLLRLSRHYDVTFLPRPLADVFVDQSSVPGNGAQPDSVLQAIDQIKIKHLSAIRSRGWIKAAKFRSRLEVERAARLYSTNQNIPAALHVIAALLWYPKPAFSRMMWRAAWRRLR